MYNEKEKSMKILIVLSYYLKLKVADFGGSMSLQRTIILVPRPGGDEYSYTAYFNTLSQVRVITN